MSDVVFSSLLQSTYFFHSSLFFALYSYRCRGFHFLLFHYFLNRRVHVIVDRPLFLLYYCLSSQAMLTYLSLLIIWRYPHYSVFFYKVIGNSIPSSLLMSSYLVLLYWDLFLLLYLHSIFHIRMSLLDNCSAIPA